MPPHIGALSYIGMYDYEACRMKSCESSSSILCESPSLGGGLVCLSKGARVRVAPDPYAYVRGRVDSNRLQPRPSPSPTRFPREEFLAFNRKNRKALTEGTVMSIAFPTIAGSARIPHSENLQFGKLKSLTDGSITKAQPGFYDGSCPAEINKHIREELGPYIVASTNTAAPCLPNFFAEGKGPNGNAAVCERQALYDGAIGARGILELRSYTGQDTLYYTLTLIYHGCTGSLKLCTVHPTSSMNPNRPIDYWMTQVNGWDMTANLDTFRQGASALRNARDWAKEKREEHIAAANRKAQDPDNSGLSSSTQSDVPLSSNEPHSPRIGDVS